MTWELEEDASSFSGVLHVTDMHSGYSGKGSVSGTVNGAALTFTLKVAVNGFEPPFENCTAEMTGQGQLDSSSITGTYAGSNSCGGTITGGQLTLTRP